MQIIIFCFLYAVMTIADPIGTHTDVNSSQLKSKIMNGKPSNKGEHKYLASLQLNGKHICSSGLFKEGFLLTTSECASYIGHGIQKCNQSATAVFGDEKTEQRINILKVAYFSTYKLYEFELGVIMLVSNVDYRHLEITNLIMEKISLCQPLEAALVCGWNTIDDDIDFQLGYGQYSSNVTCIKIKLYGSSFCKKAIGYGDYIRKLICGSGHSMEHKNTMGDIGSPLTKFIKNNGTSKNYIVGVTIRRTDSDIGTILRFIRVKPAIKYIQEMVDKLEDPFETTNSYLREDTEESEIDESNKLFKH